MAEGASIITSLPELFFGKAIKSLIESTPAKTAQSLSKPGKAPVRQQSELTKKILIQVKNLNQDLLLLLRLQKE